MKLRNKKTGEIVNAMEVDLYTDAVYLKISKDGRYDSREYGSLAELNAEWENYEEPKEFWFVNDVGGVEAIEEDDSEETENAKQIGNYFETKEEAEKAVEKLKAWKRLKDKGFRFERWLLGGEYGNTITFSDYFESDNKTRADLDLLFGGEE